MNRIIFILFAAIVALQPLTAQPSIKEVLDRLPDKTLPYVGDKHDWRGEGTSAINSTGIEDKLYTNVQMTEWWNSQEFNELGPTSCYQFIVQNSRNSLLMIELVLADYRTNMLLSVTSEGKILDQMPVAVMLLAHDIIPVMQYRITSDAKLIVSRLVPTSKTSISLYNITSFTANRVDKTYVVDENGKFKLTDTVIYRTETYTAAMLDSPDYNIYDGDEIPM